MSLCNAPAPFQSLMNSICHDCNDVFLVVNMDALLILSTYKENQYKHMEIMLSRLKEHELRIYAKSAGLCKTVLAFLNFLLTRTVFK